MEIKDLTEWFPGNVKPNFIGVYEIAPEIPGTKLRWYAWWSGSGWLPAYSEVLPAYNWRNQDPLSNCQSKSWRGLARPIE